MPAIDDLANADRARIARTEDLDNRRLRDGKNRASACWPSWSAGRRLYSYLMTLAIARKLLPVRSLGASARPTYPSRFWQSSRSCATRTSSQGRAAKRAHHQRSPRQNGRTIDGDEWMNGASLACGDAVARRLQLTRPSTIRR